MALTLLRVNPTQIRTFSLAQARSIVQEDFAPQAWIYWSDFLFSLTLGLGSYALVRKQELLSWQQGLLFAVSCLGIYRAVNFIHELVHLRTGTFKVFRFVWNLLCGIPMLVPSFMYYTHLDHHRRNHYGTDLDGEYVPLGSQSRRAIVLYLLQPLILPVLAYLRFMLLTPLAWLSPAVRRWSYEHASSMVMDPKYVRPYPTRANTLGLARARSDLLLVDLGRGHLRDSRLATRRRSGVISTADSERRSAAEFFRADVCHRRGSADTQHGPHARGASLFERRR